MIAQKYRLARWRVNKLMKRPESEKIGFFIVKYAPNRAKYHKWGIVISRKFAKLAVDRNKKRRQVYESIRLLQGEQAKKELDKYYDVVLIPYKQILTCNYQKIHQNVRDIFKFLSQLK